MHPATTQPLLARTRVFRAPGRVNLIGEHTDYNEGLVMPIAINLSTMVTITPLPNRRLVVYSENFGEEVEHSLDDQQLHAASHWSDYVRAVAMVLELSGYRLNGAHLRIRSDVPIGSGLSSSAAIEVATAQAFLANSGFKVSPIELAKLCQRAENEFVGMRCGIMDQFISCCGEPGKALMLDCRSLEYRLLPLPTEVRVVICNTMVKHELASNEYNARREDCEAAVRYFAQTNPGVHALRDVTASELERLRVNLSPVIYRRCRHVIGENERVLAAAKALEENDPDAFGRLMYESHRSLRDDYQVSSRELDLMVTLAAPLDGVYGARMTGGGFGGCVVSLVKAQNVAGFKSLMTKSYQEQTGLVPEFYTCRAVQGAAEVFANV